MGNFKRSGLYHHSGWSQLGYNFETQKAYFAPNSREEGFEPSFFIQCEGLEIKDNFLHFAGRPDLDPVEISVSHDRHWKGESRTVRIPDFYFQS